MLNKLYDDNIVNREIYEKDKRNMFYSLIEKGEYLLKEETKIKLKNLDEIIDKLPIDKKIFKVL